MKRSLAEFGEDATGDNRVIAISKAVLLMNRKWFPISICNSISCAALRSDVLSILVSMEVLQITESFPSDEALGSIYPVARDLRDVIYEIVCSFHCRTKYNI